MTNILSDINLLESDSIINLISYLSIIAGILVITAKNPIVSILYLIALFINVAIYLELSGINLLGLIYILVYVGAIAILLLFIIMLLNIKISELHIVGSGYKGEDYPLAILLSLGYIYIIFNYLSNTLAGVIQSQHYDWFTNIKANIDLFVLPLKFNTEYFLTIKDSVLNNQTSINTIIQDKISLNTINELKSIGEIFYTEYAFNLIILSIVLLLAIVAAIVVTRNSVVIKD